MYQRSLTSLRGMPLGVGYQSESPGSATNFFQWGELERFCERKANTDADGLNNMELDIMKNMVYDPMMFPTEVSPAAEKGIHNACKFTATYLAPVLDSNTDLEPASQH
ncbi:hypothetical protein PHYPSEUDO_014792 [Phytophthora pseudosyringae]|uniref:Uncharacterized protein n=1 Tax=Phytophthora pseudosyringae TaxID=221518 RepID=A0A8T1V3V4_9STRA|nr:hypothetical protein PHYPSEUDO_014792 [Phytophthora pseudosyringae]